MKKLFKKEVETIYSKIIIFFTFGGYPTNLLNYYSLYIRRGAVGAGNKIASNTGDWRGDWTHNFQINSSASSQPFGCAPFIYLKIFT